MQAGTATSRRRTCRLRPTFKGVMRWRMKDLPDLAMRCRFAGSQAVARPPSAVPAGVPAGLLAQPQPDRAAVEVPQEEGPEPLAQDIRGDAGGRGGGAG